MQALDLTGRSFGRLVVMHKLPSAKGRVRWQCLCACGAESTVVTSDLTGGHTTSCGCKRAERNRVSSLSHGKHDSPTYSSWTAMKTRCTNSAAKSYIDYGARGIKVCERWQSFENFLADMGERPEGKTLDRWPDVNGDYESSNCRWATKHEQQRNTTVNRFITYEGVTLTVAEWAERVGIEKSTLSYRVRRGWPTEDALQIRPRLGLKRSPLSRDVSGRFTAKFGDDVEDILAPM